MRRGWKIVVAIVVALIALVTVNALLVGDETKSAAVTVPEGRILDLAGGEVQVVDRGPRQRRPIVLIHCFTCAIGWWDRVMPALARDHRVVAIDLLGHGGSAKPGSGYSMEDQASLVAEALARLGVARATVVGHSLGGVVATALAVESPDLVERLVIVDQAPDNDGYGAGLPLMAALTFTPVIGPVLWQVAPDSAVEDGLSEAFAPGFDLPTQLVDDFRRMTYSSYDDSAAAETKYVDEAPLDRRIAHSHTPLLAVFGDQDQIYDAEAALAAYARVPGARTQLIAGAGHSPNLEKPAETAGLILAFAKSSQQVLGSGVRSTTGDE
jgi:pimeloyl-ACP methyl ester carboxylesterase